VNSGAPEGKQFLLHKWHPSCYVTFQMRCIVYVLSFLSRHPPLNKMSPQYTTSRLTYTEHTMLIISLSLTHEFFKRIHIVTLVRIRYFICFMYPDCDNFILLPL